MSSLLVGRLEVGRLAGAGGWALVPLWVDPSLASSEDGAQVQEQCPKRQDTEIASFLQPAPHWHGVRPAVFSCPHSPGPDSERGHEPPLGGRRVKEFGGQRTFQNCHLVV